MVMNVGCMDVSVEIECPLGQKLAFSPDIFNLELLRQTHLPFFDYLICVLFMVLAQKLE